MEELLKVLKAKYNELESLKEVIKEESSLNIITAKQHTLDDVIKLVSAYRIIEFKKSWGEIID